MFFPSPRNSTDVLTALLDNGSVSKFLEPSTQSPLVQATLKKRPTEHFTVPDLDYFLSNEAVEHFPFDHTFEEYRFRPWILLHTSGSTGVPKIIPLKHGYPTVIDAYWRLPLNEQALRLGETRMFNPFPPSHMAGLMFSLPSAIFNDSTIVLPPRRPLSAELVDTVHRCANVNYSVLPPTIVTDLANNDEYLKNLKSLRGLNFAGGPLPHDIGERVRKYVRLHNSIGATEYYSIQFKPKESEDWEWFRFNLDDGGIEFRPEGDETFEMVLIRESQLDLLQAGFVTFPDLNEYHTKDLFVRHPEKKDLWKYKGRLDDVIVFSNGEKFNPVSMENVVSTCPEVSGCVVVGQGRFQTALIVEPRKAVTTEEERGHILDAVWPYVEKANRENIKPGRVARELVMLTSPGKEFPRAQKGTILRSKTNQTYASEINSLYEKLETGRQHHVPSLDFHDVQTATISLKDYLEEYLDLDVEDIHDDLFAAGMDSLQTIEFVRAINSALKGPKIEAKDIYAKPTLLALATLLSETDSDKDDGYDSEDDVATWKTMQKMFDDVRRDIPGYEEPNVFKRNVPFLQSSQATLVSDGGRTAWLQVFGAFLININNWGIVNSWGSFQAYYQETYLSSYPATSIAWIGTVQGALLLLVGAISGPLFDRGLFQITMLIATIGLTFSFMMLSLCTHFWQILLCQGILSGFCIGLLFIPSIALVSIYFTSKRAFALGLATSGGAIGGVIYPIVFRSILNSSGFAWATRAMGFIALVTLAVAFLVIRPPSTTRLPSRQLLDWVAFKEIPFVAFMGAGFFLYAGILVPFFLGSTFAIALGSSPSTSLWLIAVLNGGQFLGRTIPPILSDYVGVEILLLVANVITTILGFCWIAVHDIPGFLVWAVFYGIATGAVSALSAAVLPLACRTLTVVGVRYGMLYSVAGVGLLISNPIATAIESQKTGYLWPQIWIGLTCLVGTTCYILTCFDARKRRQLIESGRIKRTLFGGKRRRIPQEHSTSWKARLRRSAHPSLIEMRKFSPREKLSSIDV